MNVRGCDNPATRECMEVLVSVHLRRTVIGIQFRQITLSTYGVLRHKPLAGIKKEKEPSTVTLGTSENKKLMRKIFRTKF